MWIPSGSGSRCKERIRQRLRSLQLFRPPQLSCPWIQLIHTDSVKVPQVHSFALSLSHTHMSTHLLSSVCLSPICLSIHTRTYHLPINSPPTPLQSPYPYTVYLAIIHHPFYSLICLFICIYSYTHKSIQYSFPFIHPFIYLPIHQQLFIIHPSIL